MKIYIESSLHNVLKNVASEKSISKSDLNNLRTSIGNIYNSATSIGTSQKEQTTNIIYQIEKGEKVKDFIPSTIDKECIKLMIDIHNKVNDNSSKIKEYTMILNHIEKDGYKINSTTRNSMLENLIKKELLNKISDLENKVMTANLVLNRVLNQHKLYFSNLMSKLECLDAKKSFEDKRIEFNYQQSALSNLIKSKKPVYFNTTDLSKIEKYLAKEEHNKKLDNIIEVLKDITSIYINLDKNTTKNTHLTSENILEIIKSHIDKLKEINSKDI